jgi:hypothetical protein
MLAFKRSLLNTDWILINILKTLASVISMCSLIEDHTQIFYIIDKRDIPSIQCKMSAREPKAMRKVDGLSLIFIDCYVPALIPRLNTTETSLQLSENIRLFAVCRIYRVGISKETQIDTGCLGCIIYILYNVGDRTEPCGTPAYISLGVNISSSHETPNFLWERKEFTSLSKAFSMFTNTAAVDMLLLKFKLTRSVSLIHWSVVLWRTWKPKQLAISRPLSSVYRWTILRITAGHSCAQQHRARHYFPQESGT